MAQARCNSMPGYASRGCFCLLMIALLERWASQYLEIFNGSHTTASRWSYRITMELFAPFCEASSAAGLVVEASTSAQGSELSVAGDIPWDLSDPN